MRLVSFIVRRLVFSIFTLFLLSLMIFYTAGFLPSGVRVQLFISPNAYNHPGFDIYSQIPKIIEKYHLNDPFYVQYFNWLQFVLAEGSLGYSHLQGKMVLDAILFSFPATLELVMYSAPIIIFGGIKLGVYSAKRDHEKKGREDLFDFIIRVATSLAYSIPIFFIGLLMISVFYLNLHWVTPERLGSEAASFIYSGDWNSYTRMYTIDALLNGQFWIFLDALKHLALPVATLTISMLPIIVKVTRSSMLVELSQQYVITTKAKGLRDVEVVNRAKKNAMISILTISSTLFASMLTGLIVTESIFAIGGIGLMAINAAKRYDIVLLIGISIFFCIIFVTINLIVDILYTYIDPRVKL